MASACHTVITSTMWQEQPVSMDIWFANVKMMCYLLFSALITMTVLKTHVTPTMMYSAMPVST